jgi:hypothetical protein
MTSKSSHFQQETGISRCICSLNRVGMGHKWG